MSDLRPNLGTPASRAARMTRLLQDAFIPERLEVQDDSAKHAGHAGAAAGGQTHYTVRIVSDRFSGLNRVARYRIVHETLAQEFATGLHALSLELRSPDDAVSKNS